MSAIHDRMSALADPWLRDFPAPAPDELDRYAKGTTVPQLAALALYQRLATVPAVMLVSRTGGAA